MVFGCYDLRGSGRQVDEVLTQDAVTVRDETNERQAVAVARYRQVASGSGQGDFVVG
jgi:hypothetical protein